MSNKLKVIITSLGLGVLSGCGFFDSATALVTRYQEVCVKGVTYIQFTSGATVMYDQQGHIVTCNK